MTIHEGIGDRADHNTLLICLKVKIWVVMDQGVYILHNLQGSGLASFLLVRLNRCVILFQTESINKG